MNALNTFAKTAQKLARNPLGIIALFIVLVYGIAGLVLGLSAKTLDSAERWPLIGFLVIFPVLVLGVFSWLVTKHHTKLYAPGDYQDKDGFFRALTPDEQKQRLDADVEFVIQETATEKNAGETAKERYDLRSKLALAEELAIRDIEDQHNVTVKRQVATSSGGRLDGVFIDPKNGHEVAIDVKYTTRRDWRETVKNALHIPGLKGNEGTGTCVPVILYVVTEGLSQVDMEAAKAKLRPLLTTAPYPLTLYCIALDELKKKYGFLENSES